MKTFIMAISFLLSATSAGASEAPMAAGKSTLKLEPSQSVGGVREARKALESVEKEIQALEREIIHNRKQAITLRGQRASEQQVATHEALQSVYELQKAQLVAKRSQLQSELK